jgi:hypothetical protein
MRRAAWRALAVAALVGTMIAAFACAGQEIIVRTADGKGLTAEDIDRDPLALLPGGAVAIASLDAQRLFASEFGTKLLAIAERQAPVPASAGYEPKRDLERLYVGVYSMRGVDLAGVAVGTFDRERIEQAADGVQTTPRGVPLVKTTYAGRSLYTADNVGFSVITNRTVLFGNQTGMRRALDRIDEGRVVRDVPRWFEQVAERGAPVVMGLDLRAQPVPDAVRRQAMFLDGLETAGILGNFEPPGMNLAGTLTYADQPAAERGAANLRLVEQNLRTYGLILAVLGIPQPVQRLSAQATKGNEAEFVAELEAKALAKLLDRAEQWLATLPKQTSAQGGAR